MPKLKKNLRQRCPLCNKWDHVGYNGASKYFCCECYVEFHVKKDKIDIYNITPNGALILLKTIKTTK